MIVTIPRKGWGSPVGKLFRLAGPVRPRKKELWITGFVLLICGLLLVFRPDCLIYSLFHIPCPSCGMTRAWIAALQLDFAQAFSFHPMFWSVPILYIYIVRQCRVFENTVLNHSLLGGILLGFAVNYVRVLIRFFGIL